MTMVTHPRSSEGNKDILALVKGNFVKVGNIEFGVSWRGRRLDVGLDARLFGNARDSDYSAGRPLRNQNDNANNAARVSRSRAPL